MTPAFYKRYESGHPTLTYDGFFIDIQWNAAMQNPALPSDVRMQSGDTLRRRPGLSMAFLTFAACLGELIITRRPMLRSHVPLAQFASSNCQRLGGPHFRARSWKLQNPGDSCNRVFS